MARGAAQDAAQHVAPPLVRREDPLTDEEGTGTGVIGDHAERHVVLLVRAVGLPGELGSPFEQRAKQIGVVVAGNALQHTRESLQTQARIDRRLGERHPATVLQLLELHEDQVPELDVAVSRGIVPCFEGLLVEDQVDLGAGAARPLLRHLPEVLTVGEAKDALGAKADLLPPQIIGLIVPFVDRDDQPLGCDLQARSSGSPSRTRSLPS